jgi:hypothetical protein
MMIFILQLFLFLQFANAQIPPFILTSQNPLTSYHSGFEVQMDSDGQEYTFLHIAPVQPYGEPSIKLQQGREQSSEYFFKLGQAWYFDLLQNRFPEYYDHEKINQLKWSRSTSATIIKKQEIFFTKHPELIELAAEISSIMEAGLNGNNALIIAFKGNLPQILATTQWSEQSLKDRILGTIQLTWPTDIMPEIPLEVAYPEIKFQHPVYTVEELYPVNPNPDSFFNGITDLKPRWVGKAAEIGTYGIAKGSPKWLNALLIQKIDQYILNRVISGSYETTEGAYVAYPHSLVSSSKTANRKWMRHLGFKETNSLQIKKETVFWTITRPEFHKIGRQLSIYKNEILKLKPIALQKLVIKKMNHQLAIHFSNKVLSCEKIIFE